MTSDRQLLDALAREIFHDLAFSDLRERLRLTDEDGSTPLAFALADEYLSQVMQRIHDAGGSANTFVRMENGKVRLLFVSPADKEEGSTASGADPIHQDIRMGMFVDVVYALGGMTAQVRLPNHAGDVEPVPEFELA